MGELKLVHQRGPGGRRDIDIACSQPHIRINHQGGPVRQTVSKETVYVKVVHQYQSYHFGGQIQLTSEGKSTRMLTGIHNRIQNWKLLNRNRKDSLRFKLNKSKCNAKSNC